MGSPRLWQNSPSPVWAIPIPYWVKNLFFCMLECSPLLCLVPTAHFVFLRYVRIRTQRTAVARWLATNLATHLPLSYLLLSCIASSLQLNTHTFLPVPVSFFSATIRKSALFVVVNWYFNDEFSPDWVECWKRWTIFLLSTKVATFLLTTCAYGSTYYLFYG